MMPLSMSKQGTSSAIMRVTGKSETKNFLGQPWLYARGKGDGHL